MSRFLGSGTVLSPTSK